MSGEPRYVFDTNTIVSAFLFDQSTPGIALQAAMDHGDLLISMEVAEELAEVLRRDKLDRYVRRKTREELLMALIEESTIVEITDDIRVCRDPKDDKFLTLAVSGDASCLITGDDDLLVLNSFRGILILIQNNF